MNENALLSECSSSSNQALQQSDVPQVRPGGRPANWKANKHPTAWCRKHATALLLLCEQKCRKLSPGTSCTAQAINWVPAQKDPQEEHPIDSNKMKCLDSAMSRPFRHAVNSLGKPCHTSQTRMHSVAGSGNQFIWTLPSRRTRGRSRGDACLFKPH